MNFEIQCIKCKCVGLNKMKLQGWMMIENGCDLSENVDELYEYTRY